MKPEEIEKMKEGKEKKKAIEDFVKEMKQLSKNPGRNNSFSGNNTPR